MGHVDESRPLDVPLARAPTRRHRARASARETTPTRDVGRGTRDVVGRGTWDVVGRVTDAVTPSRAVTTGDA